MLSLKKSSIALGLSLALALSADFAPLAAELEPGYVLDSSTAVYQGARQTYLIPPPADFKLVTEAPATEGYSMAFIPGDEDYFSASTIIAATIYTLKNMTFEEIVIADTIGLRQFYGANLNIRPIDSVMNFGGEPLPSFHLTLPGRFIPTAELAYYDGGNEMIIFELIISESGLPRHEAEPLFDQCLSFFKVMRNKKLADN